MLIYDKNPEAPSPVRLPALSLLSWGVGVVRFAWTFRRESPFWYAYYNYTPGAVIEFQGRELPLGPETVMLVPPHTPFATRNTAPFEHLWFHFVVAGGQPVLPEPLELPSGPFLPFLRRLHGGHDANDDFLVCGLLLLLLASVPASSADSLPADWDGRVSTAIGLLSNGCAVTETARRLGMSVGNFQRVFRRLMGISPKAFAMQMRLENARRALEIGRRSIAEIAADSGFADRYAFSKAFRDYAGCPPAAYRERTARG